MIYITGKSNKVYFHCIDSDFIKTKIIFDQDLILSRRTKRKQLSTLSYI